jgi:hypothetical protein
MVVCSEGLKLLNVQSKYGQPAFRPDLPELRMTWLAMAFMALVMPCIASNPSPTIGGAGCPAQLPA